MGAFTNNLDYWTPETPNARNPRVTSAPTANNTQRSSFWMENVGYLRLKNVLLNYDVPRVVTSKIGMQGLRLYVSGQNIITWTKLKHFDPEINDDPRGRFYPHQKVLSAGLNITF